MRRFLKILMYFTISIVVLVIALILIAKKYENQITDLALSKLSTAIEMPMEIEKVSFNLLRKFPLASIELRGVWLGSPILKYNADSSQVSMDTIAYFDKIFFSIKSKPLLENNIETVKIEFEGVDFKYFVDENGASNIDFLMDTTQTEEIEDTTVLPIRVSLREVSLKNIKCHYEDKTLQAKAKVILSEAKIKGNFFEGKLDGSIVGNLNLSNCSFEQTNLHLMERADIEFDLDYRHDSLNINNLLFWTEGAKVKIVGKTVLTNQLDSELDIACTNLNISTLQKYIPKEVFSEYGLTGVNGILNLNANIIGALGDSALPHLDVNFDFKEGEVRTTEYPVVKNIRISGKANNGILNNNQTTKAVFDVFHLETNLSKLDLKFTVQDLDHLKYSLVSELDLYPNEFKSYLPDSLVKSIDGNLKVSFSTKGVLPDSIDEHFVDYLMSSSNLNLSFNKFMIQLDSTLSIDSLYGKVSYTPFKFLVEGLKFSVPKYQTNVRKINFIADYAGKLSQLNSIGLKLSDVNLQSNMGTIAGYFEINNLENPEYKLKSVIKLNLKNISKLIPDTLIKDLSGNISLAIESEGKVNLDSIAEQINELAFEKSKFNLRFTNVSLEMANMPVKLVRIRGQIGMSENLISINNLKGDFGELAFRLDSTKIKNFYPSLILSKADTLSYEGIIDLGDIDYATLEPLVAMYSLSSPTPGEPAEKQEIQNTVEGEPPVFNYLLKGKLSVKSLTYDKRFIDNAVKLGELDDSTKMLMYANLNDQVFLDSISAVYNIREGRYVVDQFKLNAFEGKINTSLKYEDIGEDKSELWVKSNINRMNLKKLLYDLNNFDQTEISHENLSGLVSAKELNGRFIIGPEGLRDEETRIKSEFVLEKGGVYNYSKVQALAPSIPGVKNLDVLEFKTVDMLVFYFKEDIYVPNTWIISNKLDASVFGLKRHGADYKYHIEVFLSDLLTGKPNKQTKKQNAQGETITDVGRKGIKLRSFSDNGKSGQGIDSEKFRTQTLDEISESKNLLKLKFHPDVINYKTGVNFSK